MTPKYGTPNFRKLPFVYCPSGLLQNRAMVKLPKVAAIARACQGPPRLCSLEGFESGPVLLLTYYHLEMDVDSGPQFLQGADAHSLTH